MSSFERGSYKTSDEHVDSSSDSEFDGKIKKTEDSLNEAKDSSKWTRYTNWIKTKSQNITSSIMNQSKSNPDLHCKNDTRTVSTISTNQLTSDVDMFYDAETDVSSANQRLNSEEEKTIRVLDNHSFANWPKGDLLELLTKSCPEFDIKLWCDDLSKIKEFAAQNFISSNATELTAYRAINIRYEHERYQNLSNQLSSICNDFERFYENWWVEATKQKINKTAEIIADMESLNDYIKPNLNQRESKILVIGDTGVGKSSIINLILEEELMPVDTIKTTSGICEIRYSSTKCFSIAPGNRKQFQKVDLDFNSTVLFSSALKNYVANQTTARNDICNVRCRLEWPIELLKSGLVLFDSPGSNDTDILTTLVMNNLKKYFVFICVIQRGITDSLRNLLTQLKNNGLTGESIFCIVTHLTDKSQEEQQKAIENVKKEMKILFENFNGEHCVMLNPKQSCYALKKYEVYHITHFNFLKVFIPFISNILSVKLSAMTDMVRSMLQRLNIKVIKLAYDLSDIEFAKAVKNCSELKERQRQFQRGKERLETKTRPIAEKFNVDAIETIVARFHENGFRQRFMKKAHAIILPTDIKDVIECSDLKKRFSIEENTTEYGYFEFFGRVRNRRKLTDEYELSLLSAIWLNYKENAKEAISEVDFYKIYIQLQLIDWIDNFFTTILQEKAGAAMEEVWKKCSEDLQLFDTAIKNSYQFLLRENANDPSVKQKYHSILEPIITNHVKIFSGRKKAVLVTFTLGIALAAESIYDLVKGYTLNEIQKDSHNFIKVVAERLYERISNKLKKAEEKDKITCKLSEDPTAFLGDILDPFERAYIDIEQLAEMSSMSENTQEQKKLCERYLQQGKNVLLKFDNFQAIHLKSWSLNSKQIDFSGNFEHKSAFDGSIVKHGTLSTDETSRNVMIRSLKHKFNALEIWKETTKLRHIENANILRCYGAFVDETVHVVTEIWSTTLEDFLLTNLLLDSRIVLQMCMQLADAIHFLLQSTAFTEMCFTITLNTNSVMIINNDQIKLNIVANKTDFLYQTPEDLFPDFFQKSSDQETVKMQHVVYSLGLTFYRLYHRKPEQIELFNAGRWLIPNEQSNIITSEKLTRKKYAKMVEMYQKDHQFSFQTPMLDTTSCNINDTMKNLITCCYSVDSSRRPTIDVILAILKFELVRFDSKLANDINMTRLLLKSHQPKRYGLFSIDGGGTRGIIAAKIIEILEEKIKKQLWQVFDLAAGCSTGGLLTLSSLLRRTKGSELLDLYRSLADQVFSGLRIAGMQEYPEQPLEKVLKAHFGKIRMNPSEDSSKMFVVTKRNTETTPYLLRNYDLPSSSYNGESGWKCCDAARATSAAPTYFKPFWKNRESYTDGGIGFNNPVMLLFNETVSILSSELKENFSLLSDFPIAYIVSIGTGLMPNLPTPEPDAWALTRARAALNGTVEQVADAENAHNQMKNICERLKIPYFRFNPHFDKRIDLDNIQQLDEMVKVTEQYMANIDQQVNELCVLISKR